VKLFQRFYLVTFIYISLSSSVYGMVMDNRYLPWLAHVYNGTDHRHGFLSVESFFITSSSAFRSSYETKEREVGYPTLQGSLNYYDLGQSLVLAGYENPIPADWQWVSPFGVDMPGSFEGQGLSFSGYVPLSHHFGIGASMVFLRLVAQAHLIPTAETKKALNLASAGNQARFSQLTQDIEALVQTQDGFWNQSGPGDIDVYMKLFRVDEYVYYCRKVDMSTNLGLFIPTGETSSSNFIGSIPFGGNGFWGWYWSLASEIELKEDWKAGFEWRVEKRFAKTVEHRITIGKESNLFSPVTGPLYINPGVTITIAPYVALENMRDGLGLLFKYTYVNHSKDRFKDRRELQVPVANVGAMKNNSGWVASYGTLELLYDISFKHDWSYKPMCTLTWDFPFDAFGSRGSCKTHRISLGMMVDF